MDLLRKELMGLDIENLNRTALHDALYNLDIMLKMEHNLDQKVYFHNLKIQLLNRLIRLDKIALTRR